jgi:hypothetical protein
MGWEFTAAINVFYASKKNISILLKINFVFMLFEIITYFCCWYCITSLNKIDVLHWNCDFDVRDSDVRDSDVRDSDVRDSYVRDLDICDGFIFMTNHKHGDFSAADECMYYIFHKSKKEMRK